MASLIEQLCNNPERMTKKELISVGLFLHGCRENQADNLERLQQKIAKQDILLETARKRETDLERKVSQLEQQRNDWQRNFWQLFEKHTENSDG